VTEKNEIQNWWADHPMTYGSVHGETEYRDGTFTLGTREFFERLDREFYSLNYPLHDREPFDRLFAYEKFKGAKVLEIGCGLGTMAMNWAQHEAHVTAVDLNPTSVSQTKRRFELFGLHGDISLMDGNSLTFPDAEFDYVYSWGVLHHSPDLDRSLTEMMRVLKPGGHFGLMLYNRHSILHWYGTCYIEGFLHYEGRFLGPLDLASRYGDGSREEGNPHTWPVTEAEVRQMLIPYVKGFVVRRFGTELDSWFRYLLPGMGMVLPRWMMKPWARRLGWSLWATGQRK
jgi:ubiquinone/menaquinone biosynthesis C-methylase UbiE